MKENILELDSQNEEQFDLDFQRMWGEQSKIVYFCYNDQIQLPKSEDFLSERELTDLRSLDSSTRKEQFLISRWLLKKGLSRLLSIPAPKIEFLKGSLGKLHIKEELARGVSHANLDFNLSHTKEVTLIGITNKGQIGVDVEKVSSRAGKKDVAERFYHPHEMEWMRSISPGNEQDRRFFRLWSLKEAIVKAIGGGVFQNLNQFSLNISDDFQVTIQSIVEPWSKKELWQIIESDVIANHVCSIALYQVLKLD